MAGKWKNTCNINILLKIILIILHIANCTMDNADISFNDITIT